MVKYLCNFFKKITYLTFEDCISSGFWPTSPQRIGILFKKNVLKCWHYLRLLTPGTSEQKLIECLLAFSVEDGRNGVIDKKLFNEASKASDFVSYLVDKSIKNMDQTSWRACTHNITGKLMPQRFTLMETLSYSNVLLKMSKYFFHNI